MKLQKILGVFAILILMVMFSSVVFGQNLDVRYVKVNGEELDQSKNERVELADELEIDVRLEALDNVSDIEVTARITGYEYSDKVKLATYDIINIKELDEGDLETIELILDVPDDIERDGHALLVEIYNKDGQVAEYKAMLNVQGKDDFIDVRRVSFDPPVVVAGRATRARVRLHNLGVDDQDDVYVKVAIPAIGPGIVATADIDELEEDELETTEDLLLRIPECTEAGTYDAVITVEYDNGHESTEVVEQIRVLEGDLCDVETDSVESRTVITPPQAQTITAGDVGVSFPLFIKNEGQTDKTYFVSVSGVESFGSADVSTPAPFVPAGESEVVYIFLDADSDVSGQKTFIVSVSDGEDTKNIPVMVSIQPSEETDNGVAVDFRQWLYAGIIVLLVLIVIIGLAIGFRKVSNDEDEEEYY